MTVGWWWIEGGGGQGGGGMGLSMVTFSPRDYMIWKPSSSHFRCYSFHLLLNTHTHTHKLSSVPFLSLFLLSYTGRVVFISLHSPTLLWSWNALMPKSTSYTTFGLPWVCQWTTYRSQKDFK